MKNRIIVQSIYRLLAGYKKMKAKGCKKYIDSLRYLLGQSIRQYDVPEENYHISQAAKERWDELSNDCIRNYWYRKQVKCDKLTVAKRFKLYKGSEKEGKEELLNPGDPLVFRQMFHEEHTIPVSLIMNELTGSSKISTMKDIEGLLDSMHISILLKDEDRDINAKFGKTNGRSLIFSDNVKNIYNKCGITLLACPRLPQFVKLNLLV